MPIFVYNVSIKSSDNYTNPVNVQSFCCLSMIPYLPKDTSDLDICPFYKQIVENLQIRSMHHEAWHTHKRDTSVCWICDLLEISKLLINEMERVISKSALDIDEQFHGSEVFSEEGDIDGADQVSTDNRPGDI